MDTYEFINSDWTQKISEFDNIFDSFEQHEEWELWKHTREKLNQPSKGKFIRLAPPKCDVESMIENLRRPLIEMANGTLEFDSSEFQKKTNEIKFYKWVISEIEKEDYIKSFNVIYDQSLEDTARADTLKKEKEDLIREIKLRQQRVNEIDALHERSESFRLGAKQLYKIRSKVGIHVAFLLVVDFWKSNHSEIKDKYLDLPINALEIADFILYKFMGFSPEKILNLKKQRIEQEI
ncbi:hypothetical protein SH580_20375 [Coraliomargarita algicola]|uniref:Uncharacterized protein n=1 Tax=Coraliomargarita algicola TaxID=3092156 RepID=A0ABZ0RLX5_9BACT|nr:hypothetical protein [Coraliomargarita sp. J2-16]WPJ95780.1 hypothetical protein SH580_20375 [Coraliomargarita sp. J2-16]